MIWLVILFLSPIHAQSQWKLLKSFPAITGLPARTGDYPNINTIYFLDLPGKPKIGFVTLTTEGSAIWKTSDGGYSWKEISFVDSIYFPNVANFTFKDSSTGWFATIFDAIGIGSVYKTTDCGETWDTLTGTDFGSMAIRYHHATDRLMFSALYGTYTSTDEGASWQYVMDDGFYSCVFSDDSTGILTGPTVYYTTDGGSSWSPTKTPNFYSWCQQPLAIPGTKTFYLMNGYNGIGSSVTDSLYRSDDGGQNWVPLCTIDSLQVYAICGDSSHIFLQTYNGIELLTDSGTSWQNLCGPRNWYYGGNPINFYVKGKYIYAAANNDDYNLFNPNGLCTLWYLNLDSVGTFASQTVSQELNTSSSQIHRYGDTVSASFSTTPDSGVGVDTAHFTIHFDSTTLSLQNYILPYGWVTIGSSSHNGTLDLLLADTADSLVSPSVTVTFSSYLSSSDQSTISLDSVHLTGKWMGCDIATASVTSPDSVQFNFETQCGDSLVLAALENRLPFVVQSIAPNPASNSISISLQSNLSVSYEMFDELGESRLSGTVPQSPIDVSSLPAGVYYVRLSSNGYVITKTISILR